MIIHFHLFFLLPLLQFASALGKRISQSIINDLSNYGDVANTPYSISNESGEDVCLKVWVQVNIKRSDPLTSLVTVVRLDNLTKNPEKNRSYKRDSFHLDPLWRGVKGWESNLYISFDKDGEEGLEGEELVVPAFLEEDFYQFEIRTRKGWKTVLPVKKEIPSIIHQITSNKRGKQPMEVVEKAITLTKLKNPTYQHSSYSFDELGPLILELEGSKVLEAFEKLQATAYKADLFRVVILYHYGGVYLDSKMIPLLSFDIFLPTKGSYFPYDIGKNGIQGAFLALPPKDPMMRGAIDQIVENVKNTYYGTSSLQPTGPMMLMDQYQRIIGERKENKDHYKLKSILKNGIIGNWFNGRWRNMIIFHNAEYRRLATNASKCHYSHLWNWGAVYHERTCLSSFGIVPNCLDVFYLCSILFIIIGIPAISFHIFKTRKRLSLSNMNVEGDELKV